MEIVTIKNVPWFKSGYNAPVRWNRFSPEDIYFKKGVLTRNLDEEVNVISYKTKSEVRDNYTHGVFVSLNSVKTDFPNMQIDLFDRRSAVSAGSPNLAPNAWRGMDNLVYIYSCHQQFQWVNDPQKGWTSVRDPNYPTLPDDDGYAINLNNFTEYHPNSCQESMDIIFSVRKFLIEKILKEKRMMDEKKS